MLEVKIFLDEDDKYQDKPLHEYIMRYLMRNQIMGAIIFPSIMGFGHKHHLHTPTKFGNVDERPIMILFIDEKSKVQAVLPHIKEVVLEGLVVTSKVDII